MFVDRRQRGLLDRYFLLKNLENVEVFTNLQKILTAVVWHATIFYYDCEDSTKIIENSCFVKNPGKLVKNPENFEELSKIEESSHPILNMGTIYFYYREESTKHFPHFWKISLPILLSEFFGQIGGTLKFTFSSFLENTSW